MATEIKTEKLDFEKVWFMFQESDRKFQETKELLEKTRIQTYNEIKETDIKFKKVEEETKREFKKLMKKLSEIETRWGKFVEALVDGTLINILNEKGIDVQHTFMRAKGRYKKKQYEFDIIAKDGQKVVAVEVKTTLSVNDVNRFLSKLNIFKEVFPEYSTNEIIGAVAYISVEGESHRYAARNGLFVIKATNESARIINRENFKPKLW
jgi:hypothetical protein